MPDLPQALPCPSARLEQLVRIAQHDALPPALDQALLLPRAENAARRCCRVVPVISATSCRLIGKVDLDALLDLAAGLLGKPQQRMRNAPLDLFAGHLDDAGLGVLQPVADGLQRARRDRRKFCDQPRPAERGRPRQRTLLSTAATRRRRDRSERHIACATPNNSPGET